MSKKILIVEDDQDILFALSSLLEDEGYTVQTAENGLVALELLKKSGLPQLILLDMIMPVMTGWQFALEFNAMYDHQCPIIVMTAAADAEQRAKDIGAAGWIGKPFALDKLFKMINENISPLGE
ncbi:MAG: response regulator [Bacteriovorax sp.]|jgi:CheY-like chemotaxis protein